MLRYKYLYERPAISSSPSQPNLSFHFSVISTQIIPL